MSSSIEEQFDPPEWATREEVIKAARHYINYWKIEARQRNAQWLEAIKPRPPAWQPIDTAPKDGKPVLLAYRDGYFGDMVVTKAFWDEDEKKWDKLFSNEYIKDIPTHWMPLPTPPAYDPQS